MQRGRLFCRWPLGAIAGVFVGILCLGCGNDLNLAPVDGVVQFEGTPMTGGSVLLSPFGGGNLAVGGIQEDGKFQLTTLQSDGAVPGRYRVSIVSDLKIRGKLVHATCVAPPSFVLEVGADKENKFEIDVKFSDGWKLSVDD